MTPQVFAFGENWRLFLSEIDENRVAAAEQSLKEMIGRKSLAGLSFLDIGSGSGLLSLAACRLGARVHSFDADPQSVACTLELKKHFFVSDSGWIVEHGSILDETYIQSLGLFDIVYAWGVLHHTGAMWKAMRDAQIAVAPGGTLFIAIYNDQGWASRGWRLVKWTYNILPALLKPLLLGLAFTRLWGPRLIQDSLRGRSLKTWRDSSRGMSAWRDVVDWVGGYPFEVAKPEDVVLFYQNLGFELVRLKTCGKGHGCNEYVLRKIRGGHG